MSELDADKAAPVVVNKNPAASQARATLRLLLGYGLAYAAGRGWISKELADILGPYTPQVVEYVVLNAPIVAVFAWSQFATWRKHKVTVMAAEAAPNTVAVVK